jgi:hypothetical protein
MLRLVVSKKLTDVSDMFTASIISVTATSETLFNFYETKGRNIPETFIFEICFLFAVKP